VKLAVLENPSCPPPYINECLEGGNGKEIIETVLNYDSVRDPVLAAIMTRAREKEEIKKLLLEHPKLPEEKKALLQNTELLQNAKTGKPREGCRKCPHVDESKIGNKNVNWCLKGEGYNYNNCPLDWDNLCNNCIHYCGDRKIHCNAGRIPDNQKNSGKCNAKQFKRTG
jgi:hypothetical protein